MASHRASPDLLRVAPPVIGIDTSIKTFTIFERFLRGVGRKRVLSRRRGLWWTENDSSRVMAHDGHGASVVKSVCSRTRGFVAERGYGGNTAMLLN